MSGVVHLVGAGPGPADLLTLRAARLLAEADIVLHDALVSPEVLALASRARLVPVGKRAGRPSVPQALINRLLVRAARRYAVVVRLKGGDPMLFARAQEEIDACAAARVAVEITPGVSAAFAAAADFNASLTQRGVSRSVAFVTPAVGRGEQGDDHWAKAAAAADTAVVYMGSQDAAGVRSALLAAGVPATRPAAFIERAGGDAPRILPGSVAELPTMAEGLGDGPALLVIGAVLSAATAQALAHIGQAA